MELNLPNLMGAPAPLSQPVQHHNHLQQLQHQLPQQPNQWQQLYHPLPLQGLVHQLPQQFQQSPQLLHHQAPAPSQYHQVPQQFSQMQHLCQQSPHQIACQPPRHSQYQVPAQQYYQVQHICQQSPQLMQRQLPAPPQYHQVQRLCQQSPQRLHYQVAAPPQYLLSHQYHQRSQQHNDPSQPNFQLQQFQQPPMRQYNQVQQLHQPPPQKYNRPQQFHQPVPQHYRQQQHLYQQPPRHLHQEQQQYHQLRQPAPLAGPIYVEITDNRKEKCHSLLVTLLDLMAKEPPAVEMDVRNLIQELIDAEVEPEEFYCRLEWLIDIGPQPTLISFLKQSLPLLRHSLMTKELTIEGISPPAPIAPLVVMVDNRRRAVSHADGRYEVSQEVERQLKFLEELHRADKKRRED